MFILVFFFFFSSRRRHTRYWRDWSSDVCSSDLTALDIANASLLDEATAAAEAMTMCHALKDGRNVFFVSEDCHPQNIDVVKTRAKALGIEVVVGKHENFQFSEKVF